MWRGMTARCTGSGSRSIGNEALVVDNFNVIHQIQLRRDERSGHVTTSVVVMVVPVVATLFLHFLRFLPLLRAEGLPIPVARAVGAEPE
jgi:hypothetical protein